MPKRMKGITKMKATQHRTIGKGILSETSKAYTKTGTAKQRARSTRFHTAVITSLDPTYMDRTGISF
jgi:hypothetical protein